MTRPGARIALLVLSLCGAGFLPSSAAAAPPDLTGDAAAVVDQVSAAVPAPAGDTARDAVNAATQAVPPQVANTVPESAPIPHVRVAHRFRAASAEPPRSSGESTSSKGPPRIPRTVRVHRKNRTHPAAEKPRRHVRSAPARRATRSAFAYSGPVTSQSSSSDESAATTAPDNAFPPGASSVAAAPGSAAASGVGVAALIACVALVAQRLRRGRRNPASMWRLQRFLSPLEVPG
jgi:hypothetical protein